MDPPLRDTEGELLIDQETGLVVWQQWQRTGDLVSSTRMTSLSVNGPVDPELFTFTPAAGAHVTAGVPLHVPGRYRPAIVVGVLAAVVGDAVATLLRTARRGPQR